MAAEIDPIKRSAALEPLQTSPRDAFLNRLTGVKLPDMHSIMSAYDLAEQAHQGQFRASGEPYFSHPRQTATILLDLGIRSPGIIGGALGHDIAEDTDALGTDTPDTIPYLQWRERIRERMIERSLTPEVADIIISLTKPRINGIEIRNLTERREAYAEILEHVASPEALLVKMADRLHNLQTIKALPLAKQSAVIKETRKPLFRIFERVLDTYPDEGRELLSQMKEVMDRWKERSHLNP